MTAELIIAVVTALGSGGAAWAGVKATLNGTVKRVETIESDVKEIKSDVGKIKEEQAYLKGLRAAEKASH